MEGKRIERQAFFIDTRGVCTSEAVKQKKKGVSISTKDAGEKGNWDEKREETNHDASTWRERNATKPCRMTRSLSGRYLWEEVSDQWVHAAILCRYSPLQQITCSLHLVAV